MVLRRKARQLCQRNVLWRPKQAGEEVSQHSQAQFGPATTAFAQLHLPQSQPMFEPLPKRLDRAVIDPKAERFARPQRAHRTNHAEGLRTGMVKQDNNDPSQRRIGTAQTFGRASVSPPGLSAALLLR